ncbi:hypothetical protein HOD61_02000 [archaeon]|jgi:hypothetical protein|nr:hypothetical protein [archaeon]
MAISEKELQKILNKYKSKLDANISTEEIRDYTPSSGFSKEYESFKKEYMATGVSTYEKLCSFAESIIKITPSEQDSTQLEESIKFTHLKITPTSAASFSMFVASLFMFVAVLIGGIGYFVFNNSSVLMLSFLFVVGALVSLKSLTKIPIRLANRWRLQASNQMVLCILYIVIYMRHTSNLENALKFAADHIRAPLSLDLRKIFWDVETGKFSTMKESLEFYLSKWRDYNLEFVNSFHLIESSLYEPNEERRIELLDKSLKLILDGTYERMLKYAHDLKNPITMLYMLGVILPILGLVIFPLIGSFMGGLVQWWHLAFLYNLILPVMVYSMGTNILSQRPTGYGANSVEVKSKKGTTALAVFLLILFTLLGTLPFILHTVNPGFDMNFMGEKFLDFECFNTGKCYGPFGLGAALLSLFLPLGIAVGAGIYFTSKTKDARKIRKEIKKLESEFSVSLFQLGTRIGDGIPTESAFKDVAENMGGTSTGDFFSKIHVNLTQGGMNLKEAIFDSERGAIINYNTPLIESSMEVLVESSHKGPQVVSRALISISDYISKIHKINERLKDLLADIISSMKGQIKFLTPIIAGIVVGISTMIVGVISKLSIMTEHTMEGDQTFTGGMGAMSELFNKVDTIPSYFFQIIVGIYVVQIVYLLTILSSGIEHGPDKINEQSEVGSNLIKSTTLYLLISLIVMLLFSMLASSILPTF